MLYTSDHGENLFDDSRRLFLHASPRASIYELHVPFLLWLSDTYITAYPDNAAAVSANRRKRAESSVTTFHTILQLAGINADEWEGIGHCALGFRKGEVPEPKPRKADFVHWIR